MSATITFNSAEFTRVLQQAANASSRTFPQFINSRAMFVAKKAIEDTEKADASKIAYQLAGNVRTKIRISKKTGQRKAVRQYDVMEGSLAAKIINAKLVRKGQKPIWGAQLAKEARRLIGARLRAVTFIRSGWVFAIRTLAPLAGGNRFTPGTARMTGQPKGYARPARFALNSVVSCEIGNTALLHDGGKSPMPVAQRGLASALDREAKEMMTHLQKKLQPVLNQFSAK